MLPDNEQPKSIRAADEPYSRKILALPKGKVKSAKHLWLYKTAVGMITEWMTETLARKKPLNLVELAGLFGLTTTEYRQGVGFPGDNKTKELLKKSIIACEADLTNRLLVGKPPIGLIFYLKNHYGYQDKSALETELGIVVKRVSYASLQAKKTTTRSYFRLAATQKKAK